MTEESATQKNKYSSCMHICSEGVELEITFLEILKSQKKHVSPLRKKKQKFGHGGVGGIPMYLISYQI